MNKEASAQLLNEKMQTFSVKVYHAVDDILHFIVCFFLVLVCGALLVDVAKNIFHLFDNDSITHIAVTVVDKLLFVIMVLEIAHTVLIAYQRHILRPEPFLVVGIIASIRRILLLSIDIVDMHGDTEAMTMALVEISILGFFVLALAGAVVLLRKAGDSAEVVKHHGK